MKRILILSASFGEGHRQAAFALKEYFQEQSPELEVDIVDYIDSIHPRFNRMAKFVYIQSIKRAPKMYGYFYRQVDRVKPTSKLYRRIGIIGMKKLLAYLLTFKPDLIIHTFPTSAGVVSQLRRAGKINIPSVMVITDYSIHSQWLQPDVDLFLVGSNDVRNQLETAGISKENIAVTGIPVRSQFKRHYDRKQINLDLGLSPDIPTVLVMGGAYGVSRHIVNLCEQLFNSKEDIQVIVICGRNQKLYNIISELQQDAKNKTLVFGFTVEVAKLMSISDIMFTKSGGITTSEGIAMAIPMVLFRPIPGQEMSNAQFLKKAGAAEITRDVDEIELFFSRIINSEKQLRKMKDNCEKLRDTINQQSVHDAINSLFNSTSHYSKN